MKPVRRSSNTVSPARATAFEILLRVDREGTFASELLHSSRYKKLSPADHGLATEIVMGVLRWRSVLDSELQTAASQKLAKLDSEVLCALRMGLYQLRFLARVPGRAAIYESVESMKSVGKKSAGAFVNAVLRKLNAQAAPDPTVRFTEKLRMWDTIEGLARRLAHPLWLVERWGQEYGTEAAAKICLYDQQVPQTAVRIRDRQTEQELEAEGIEIAPGALLSSARRIVSGDVTRTTAFREGRLAIQDEASQLIARLVGKGNKLLDCCAAPGGKTAIIADHDPNAVVFAAELHPHRARLLRRLVRHPNVRVVAADSRQLPFGADFDCALVDVPCSGTGTLARNPEIKWKLELEDLRDLQARQIEILRSAMAAVAPEGRIVYSTCSLEREENADVVERVATGSFRIVSVRDELEKLQQQGELVWKDLDTLTAGLYFRTIPGVHPGDGFFAAVLEKVA